MNKKGFSLFEVLIVITLVSAAIFPLLLALSSTLLVSDTTDSDIIALNLAQAKIETIKDLPWPSITDEVKTAVSNFTTFQREVIVNTAAAGLKDITVIVYYTPSGGTEQHVSFETYVTEL